MQNYDFKRNAKKCSKTERLLLPGDAFYSALVESGNDTERLNFCEEAWDGPPGNCLGWWKSRMPEATQGKIYWAPDEVLLAFFDHVASQPEQADVAYVTALLLLQKKLLWLDDGWEEPDESVLRVKNREQDTYQVSVLELNRKRVSEIQDELGERLFTDQLERADEEMEDELDISATTNQDD